MTGSDTILASKLISNIMRMVPDKPVAEHNL